MVADGSLALLEETDAYWSFSFRPRTESDEESEFMQSVEGQLQVVKDGHYVSRVTMRNTKPIRPGMGVKIKVFDMTLQCAPAFEAGPVLPRSVRVAIEGRALLVAKIEETESVEFSDYERFVE